MAARHASGGASCWWCVLRHLLVVALPAVGVSCSWAVFKRKPAPRGIPPATPGRSAVAPAMQKRVPATAGASLSCTAPVVLPQMMQHSHCHRAAAHIR